MAFYLVKNKKFKLGAEGEVRVDICHRTINVPVCIEPIETALESLSGEECANLKELVENYNEFDKCIPEKSESDTKAVNGESEPANSPLDWTINVNIGMVCVLNVRKDSTVTLTPSSENSVLTRLQSLLDKHGLKLKIRVRIDNFFCNLCFMPTVCERVTYMESMETHLDSLTSTGAVLTLSNEWKQYRWNPTFSCSYGGAVTISCFLHSVVCGLTTTLFRQNGSVNQKILKEEINCDAVIIAKDNISLKCHKAFLSGISTVFESMFSGDNYEESKTGTVEMPDMTEAGVGAFLMYVYTQKIDQARENCGIALELLQAGHKYGIPSLEESMKIMMLAKPEDWYEAEIAMKLYLFARNMPDGKELKAKAIIALKKNVATLRSSEVYRDLYKDDPSVAMELFEFSVFTLFPALPSMLRQ